jgi:hypothetical protein
VLNLSVHKLQQVVDTRRFLSVLARQCEVVEQDTQLVHLIAKRFELFGRINLAFVHRSGEVMRL